MQVADPTIALGPLITIIRISLHALLTIALSITHAINTAAGATLVIHLTRINALNKLTALSITALGPALEPIVASVVY